MKAVNTAIGTLALALLLGACTTAVRSGSTEGQALPRDLGVDPRVEAKCDGESRRAWSASPTITYPGRPDWSITKDIQRGLYRQCLDREEQNLQKP